MLIYEMNDSGQWTGVSRDISETEGSPRGWTSSPPPGNIPSGMVAVWTGGSWVVSSPALPTPVTSDQVDQERDRRIDGGFVFQGKSFQSRPDDRENIAGASTAALSAIVAGAQPGDLRWDGGDQDFAWISLDNTLVPMDAQTVFDFGKTAMAHKQSHIFAARAIKDLSPIPQDYRDDRWWPSVS
jgi:hypothetical protein